MPELTKMERDTTQPGLWINRNWQEGTSGVYAAIIGISRYQYLNGAAEVYYLPQLAVSALTAYRFFEWLTQEYYRPECPVAKCWLLLAPSQAELDFEPRLASFAQDASYAPCALALQYWHRDLLHVPAPAADNSRALFFFSGHGLESHQEKQILLPADYLAPPGANINAAISTQNLRFGLASSPVARQFFYIDACRNDLDALRQKGLEGTKILNEDEAAKWNRNIVAPVMYATASGSQAWQQPAPSAGLSLFGRALLDGLRGRPDCDLKCDASFCSVRVFPLQTFVEDHVNTQLAAANSSERQNVRLGGNARNEDVTLLRVDGSVHPDGVPVRPSPTGPPLTAPVALERASQVNKLPLPVRNDVPDDMSTKAWATHYDIGHRIFEREPVTDIWSNRLKLYALGAKKPVDPNDFQLLRVSLTEQRTTYQTEVTFRIHDPKGFWVELRDFNGRWFGAALPTDQGRPLKYLLETEFTPDANRIVRMRAGFAANNDMPLSAALDLWRRYRTGDLVDALRTYDALHLESILHDKMESPFSAILAVCVLLRASRTDLLHDWVANLTRFFPEYSDSAVLWAEQLIRQGKLEQACDALLLIKARGLPFMAECLAYAAASTERLASSVTPERAAQLRQVQDQIKRALNQFRPGTAFVVLTGGAEDPRPGTPL